MSENFGPIYEVTHCVDRDIMADFDAWLVEHISAMLEIPGVSRAANYAAGDDEQGRMRRVTQYFFDSDASLEQYLAGPADVMRLSAAELFGDRFEVSRRVLQETEIIDGELQPAEICLNCGTTLSGQYCGNCGQRARSRLISIWELLQEAFGDLFELDSRLWRTLIPLAIRPGKLTREYLEGRRARFMPPFRTYLVLSIFFFLIAFFDPREELGILFESAEEVAAEAENSDAAGSADEIREEVFRELADEGVIATRIPDAEDQDLGVTGGRGPATEASTVAGAATAPDQDESGGFNIRIGDSQASTSSDCEEIDTEGWPPWLSSRLTPQRVQLVCERMIADDGRAFVTKLLDNIPAALFVLLPLMALILKILYPLSKRFYVEHLLFVIHFHAFAFLLLTLQILLTRTAALLGFPDGVTAISVVAVTLYMPIYLFKAMRRVYGQGRVLSFLKFLVLLLSYFFGLTAIFFFAAIFAAFSI